MSDIQNDGDGRPEGQEARNDVILVEGMGYIPLPEGLQMINYPHHTFENLALAMKRVYSTDIAAGLPIRVASASAQAVGQTIIRPLPGEEALIQKFVETTLILVINNPTVLLNKLEALANFIWEPKNSDWFKDQPGDFTYRRAISMIVLEISNLVDAIHSNQNGAIINQEWVPDHSYYCYNTLQSLVTN